MKHIIFSLLMLCCFAFIGCNSEEDSAIYTQSELETFLIRDSQEAITFWTFYFTIYFSTRATNSSAESEWMVIRMGLSRSREKIPIMDFASTMYLPLARSTSKSQRVTSFTKLRTSSMVESRISKICIISILLKINLSNLYPYYTSTV